MTYDMTENSDMIKHRSETLADRKMAIYGLETNDGVVQTDVSAETMHGRPFARIEVRMNEYGMISMDPRADDPVSELLQECGLEIYQITPTTGSTSRMDYHIVDPDDGYDEGETNE